MTKVLVTGGAGFIGTAMARYLLNKGLKVRTIDLTHSSVKGAESYVGSILDPNCVLNAIEGCDYVIHLAAMLGVKRTEIERLSCLEINIQGTKNILDACVKKRIKKIVFGSSSEVYGEAVKTPISEDDPKSPKSIYAITKLAGEEYLKAYKQNFNLDYSIVRFFNVYGSGQVAEFVMPRFIKCVIENKSPTIYGDGNQIRAFTFVEDIVKGVYLVLMNDCANSEAFNIGNDAEPITMKELAERIIKISGKDLKLKFIPMKDSDRDTSREIVKRVPDISKAKTILGYQPTTPLTEGIRKVMESNDITETWYEPLIKSE